MKLLRPLLPATLVLLAAGPALAHTGTGMLDHVHDGFLHPMLGADHLLAMVGVGLWAAQIGGRALWALPLSFIGFMVGGAALGMAGIAMPEVETLIGVSLLLFGIVVALAWKPATPLAMAITAFFALAHGHAHGAELPEAATPVAYAAGFVIATALLHGVGLAAGLLLKARGAVLVRALGGLVALGGAYFLIA